MQSRSGFWRERKAERGYDVDGVVHVTFLGVTDDAHVFDTLSGALLDVRIQLEVQPNLDVKIRRK